MASKGSKLLSNLFTKFYLFVYKLQQTFAPKQEHINK